MNNFSYCGVLIKVNPYLTELKPRVRTWKERLFSRPWQPFKKLEYVESPGQIYKDTKKNTWLMSPMMADILKKELANREKRNEG